MNKQTKSFLNAFKGIGYTILNEAHLRFHIVATAFVIFFGILFNLSPIEWAVLCLVFSLVMALELVNTAVERVCDLYSTDYHPLIKIAKDVCAGAVLISAMGSIGVACVIFIKPDKIIEVFNMFLNNPLYIVLLILSIALALVFIVKCHAKTPSNKNCK